MKRPFRPSTLASLAVTAGCALPLAGMILPAGAFAQGDSPWWRVSAGAAPTNMEIGKEARLHIVAVDVGDGQVDPGKPVTVTDTLPPGLEATSAEAQAGSLIGSYSPVSPSSQAECEVQPTVVTCTYPGPHSLIGPEPLIPFEPLEVVIDANVSTKATGAAGSISVAGGETDSGAEVTPVTIPQSIAVGGETHFDVKEYELVAENEGGTSDIQAGSHPFQLTTAFNLNQALVADEYYVLLVKQGLSAVPKAVAEPKDLLVRLPPGLVGNATYLPRCSEPEFTLRASLQNNGCPADSAVGVATVTLFAPEVNLFTELQPSQYYQGEMGASRQWGGVATATVPVFNLTPAPGEPARFGFDAYGNFVSLDTSVATGKDYAVVSGSTNIVEIASLLSSQITLWGEPGDPRHSRSRGWHCIKEEGELPSECEATFKREYKEYEEAHPAAKGTERAPFLRLPTSCQASLKSSVEADSWPEPAARKPDGSIPTHAEEPRWKEATFKSPPLQGCEQLPFTPSLKVEPDTSAGSTPSGFKFDVHLPQVEHETEEGLAESDVKTTTVTLPQGVLLSPAAAHGLESCSEGQVGFERKGELEEPLNTEPGDSLSLFTSNLPESGFCPSASKVGNVRIQTPLLEHEIEGGVYLAAQNANPFPNPSLIALYIVAKDPVSGVVVKLAGQVSLNESTGQITNTFENTPQTPFEDLKLEFFGGQDASLTTPPYCGTHTTEATFTPWSGAPPVTTTSSFDTTSNCTNGGSQPFSPSFSAGPTNAQAGAYSPFTLTLGNPDGDQPLKNLTMHLPPGFAAMLSTVTELCSEQQSKPPNECPAASEIGHSTAVSGLGGDPYDLPGTAYLTGPFKNAPGAPFGISVVTPAKAGGTSEHPTFDLGNIVVHSAIYVNRETAAVTIASEPFPEFIKGVPSQLKEVNVVVDRPGFEFNPTNCLSQMSITGTLTGGQGASANVSQPTQVGNCLALPFKPKLTASTLGNATKANGAQLIVRVESSFGQANIAKTKLVLPVTLPSRLTTIQKACLDSVFEKNPAMCDEGSNIGYAKAFTPVLKEPLSGPAYLVSHGNAAFPDVEFVLSNREGIELILDGQTDIKKGITTSTFNSVPDAPVSVFETVLPEGPHSALTSNVAASKKFSLCGAKLTIPTTITGQNGVVINQQTPVPVKGCGVKGYKASRAALLAKALKKCRKQFKHKKKKRVACEKKARKKYGPKKHKKHKKHKKK
jgi:hypothetical protein